MPIFSHFIFFFMSYFTIISHLYHEVPFFFDIISASEGSSKCHKPLAVSHKHWITILFHFSMTVPWYGFWTFAVFLYRVFLECLFDLLTLCFLVLKHVRNHNFPSFHKRQWSIHFLLFTFLPVSVQESTLHFSLSLSLSLVWLVGAGCLLCQFLLISISLYSNQTPDIYTWGQCRWWSFSYTLLWTLNHIFRLFFFIWSSSIAWKMCFLF